MALVKAGERWPGEPHWEDFERTCQPILIINASAESVHTMLTADSESEDGRSQWLWIRFPNGDLVFGCFPQGDTYFATETDHSA